MSKSTDILGLSPVGKEVLHRLSWPRSLSDCSVTAYYVLPQPLCTDYRAQAPLCAEIL